MTGTNILSVRGLGVEYYRNKRIISALRGVTLDLRAGETLAIVGESGCGKSTLALALAGLIFPHEGRIHVVDMTFRGHTMMDFGPDDWRAIRGKEISVVFQDPFAALNPVMRIGEQVDECVRAHAPDIGREERTELVRDALSSVMFPDPARIQKAYPHQLSGGQLQRIVIAMAIVNRPRVLIADEPTASLDMTTQKELLDLLDTLQERLGISIILITHSIPVAFQRGNRVAVMYAGDIIESGLSPLLKTSPRHPYTRALLDAVPHLCDHTDRATLTGQHPDSTVLPLGCKYFPRCARAIEVCKTSEPDRVIADERMYKCFLPLEDAHE